MSPRVHEREVVLPYPGKRLLAEEESVDGGSARVHDERVGEGECDGEGDPRGEDEVVVLLVVVEDVGFGTVPKSEESCETHRHVEGQACGGG